MSSAAADVPVREIVIKTEYIRVDGNVATAEEGDAERARHIAPPSERHNANANHRQKHNKKRKRAKAAAATERFCFAAQRPGGCQRTDCRFRHDVENAPQVEEQPKLGDACAAFDRFGYCPRHAACRFGSHGDTSACVDGRQRFEASYLNDHVDIRAVRQTSKAVAAEFRREHPEARVIDIAGAELGRALDWSGLLYLAPLTTVGNLPFRVVCKQLGADVTCAEMALTRRLLQGERGEWRLLRRHASEDRFGVQVCSNDPAEMYAFTRAFVGDERLSADFIDVNAGCPLDLVCRFGGGARLIEKQQRAERLARAMRLAARQSIAITLKTRTGETEGAEVAADVLAGSGAWGLDAVALHGRSRRQRYKRQANWQYVGEVARRLASTSAELGVPKPVFLGNGDIYSWRQGVELLERDAADGGVDALMIARGALIKPWLFTEIKERRHWDITAQERLRLIERFCAEGLMLWGSDTRGVQMTRTFLMDWLNFAHRYTPVGVIDGQVGVAVDDLRMHMRPPAFVGRNDLETLLASPLAVDWLRISEMFLGKATPDFSFSPKHAANAWSAAQPDK